MTIILNSLFSIYITSFLWAWPRDIIGSFKLDVLACLSVLFFVYIVMFGIMSSKE